MEKTEIDYRITSLILYMDSVERSDVPLELKREKLAELEKEKLFLENILDERKFKEFFKANPDQAQNLKDREKDAALNAKFQIYNSLISILK